MQNLFLHYKISKAFHNLWFNIFVIIIIGIRDPYYFPTIDNNLNNSDENLLVCYLKNLERTKISPFPKFSKNFPLFIQLSPWTRSIITRQTTRHRRPLFVSRSEATDKSGLTRQRAKKAAATMPKHRASCRNGRKNRGIHPVGGKQRKTGRR